MQFLPVRHERYRSAIRIYLHKQLQKFGTNKKIILQIRNLRLCEILLRAPKMMPTKIHLFFDCLLNAAALKTADWGQDFSYSIRGNINAQIDREVAETISLLLIENSLSNEKAQIKIIIRENNVYIFANSKVTRLIKRVVIKAKGTYISTENTIGISLPIKKSAQTLEI